MAAPLRSVAVFYVLAFSISWLIEIPQVAASRGLLHLQLPGIVGFLSPLAPMLAALLVSAGEGGWAKAGQLLSRLLQWRAAPWWWVVVLLGFPVLALVAIGLAFLATAHAPDFSNGYIRSVFPQFPRNLSPWLLVLPFLLYSIITSIPEEVGWRGFALPRLQERAGAVYASLAVGALWAVWHLPLFFYPQAVQSGISFPLFLAATLSGSILFTWVFNGTGGSLLMVSVLHSSFNASDVFLPLLPQVTGTELQLVFYLAVITLVAAFVAASGHLRPT
jgi:membrane protease YdiL (CAAX protease family)